jgi:glycosyltransferase involved in cell wall biosynthesis
MEDSIFISVLIANFNNAEFLENCIKSVALQNLHKDYFEILICDDYSTDNSYSILKSLQSKYNFQLYKNEKNQGVGYTKSHLIKKSIGSWFLFVDSDDELNNNCLQVFVNFIKSNENNKLSFIYANSERLNQSNEITSWNRSKLVKVDVLKSKFDYPIFHPVLYNRKKYNLTIGMDSDLKCAEDFDLWYKMEEVGKIVFIDLPLYRYRINPNGLSQYNNDKIKWLEIVLEHAFCSAQAARRRGIDSRAELNEFAKLIVEKFHTKQTKKSLVNKLKCFFRNNYLK